MTDESKQKMAANWVKGKELAAVLKASPKQGLSIFSACSKAGLVDGVLSGDASAIRKAKALEWHGKNGPLAPMEVALPKPVRGRPRKVFSDDAAKAIATPAPAVSDMRVMIETVEKLGGIERAKAVLEALDKIA